jgi:transposase-like protein
VGKAWDEVSVSFDRFCLAAGMEALGTMMEKDAEEACGPRHGRGDGRRGHRWGHTRGKIGFHGGRVELERPRVRGLAGKELALPSWERAVAEDWLGQWAMNLMLINVSTRKIRRAVRLPEGDVPAPAGAGVSKSAASRHFVALSAARMKVWMGSDLSALDIMVVQIDGIHISEHLVLVAAIGIDGEGEKHPLGLIEGATEHSAVVQALIDDLIARGLDPAVPRLFIIDGAKALAKAIRRSFGRHTPIQRCQIHKARNIMERLSPALHASVRRALRQAWELDDADKAEKLLRNLAQRLERDAPGVSKSILEGLDEILTVSRLGLPAQLRRSLACTNIIENMMGTVRRVTRNVKRWTSASMALRWTAAAMLEAKKGFRRLKAYKQLYTLRAALNAHYEKTSNKENLAQQAKAA